MTHRVAIAISGAVSLGSYEAGTIYEIIKAIDLHNHDQNNERIEIDILTGASAGGMTAAIVAQKLMYEADTLRLPYSNACYDAWIEKADIDGLLKINPGDNANTSILSSSFIKQIADDLVLSRYKLTDPVRKKHSACAKELRLGLALANLNGVDYSLPTFSGTSAGLVQGEFILTRHQDRLSLAIKDEDDNQSFWSRVVLAGCASGAFPVAFSPLRLKREWNEQDYAGRGAKDFSALFPSGLFSYADGGTFNNYPLGMAKNLAKDIDKHPNDYKKRHYFYISPHGRESAADYSFNADQTSMLGYVKRIVAGIFWQARFQDWMMTDDINASIITLDKRAKVILEIVTEAHSDQLNAMKSTVDTLIPVVFEPSDSENENLEIYKSSIQRLEQQYKDDIDEGVVLTELQKYVWVNSIAIMERISGLSDKDLMNVYTITAGNDELASEPLVAFLGFLDKKFRRHDYMVGRINGLKTINNILQKKGEGGHLPLNIDPPDFTALEAEVKKMNLGQASISDVDRKARIRVYQRGKERIYLYLKQFGLNAVFRRLLFNILIQGKLKKLLDLN